MKPITETERRIIDVLVYEGKLPTTPFEVTEQHVIHYMHAYVNVLNKKSFKLDTSDYRYARKLAALSIMKHLSSVGQSLHLQPAGFVYMIENPAFPDHYKVGMTVDLENRLASYQTYDPYKKFKIVKSEFVLNRRATERMILNSFGVSIETGEWVKKPSVERIFNKIASTHKKVYA